jgi:hypothetical protein
MPVLFFYTDPGSGVMLLQLLLATAAGAVFYFRSFFFRLFGVKKTNSTEVTEENDENSSK